MQIKWKSEPAIGKETDINKKQCRQCHVVLVFDVPLLISSAHVLGLCIHDCMFSIQPYLDVLCMHCNSNAAFWNVSCDDVFGLETFFIHDRQFSHRRAVGIQMMRMLKKKKSLTTAQALQNFTRNVKNMLK